MEERDALVGEPAPKAVPLLVERYGSKMMGLGLKLCRSREEAEDLVQETFLQAFRKWEQFKGDSTPSSWLYTIAARICQRRHRRRSGEPAHLESLDELLPIGGSSIVDLPSAHEGPFDEQLRREAAEVVDRALAQLPLDFRLPLVLKEIAELPLRQIADILGVKEATVKTRVHRARLALRKELAPTLPQRAAPPPDHPRQVCLSLLESKLEALDRGVPFPVANEELCSRCRALFDSLDLTAEACRWVRGGELPAALRHKLITEMR